MQLPVAAHTTKALPVEGPCNGWSASQVTARLSWRWYYPGPHRRASDSGHHVKAYCAHFDKEALLYDGRSGRRITNSPDRPIPQRGSD